MKVEWESITRQECELCTCSVSAAQLCKRVGGGVSHPVSMATHLQLNAGWVRMVDSVHLRKRSKESFSCTAVEGEGRC